MDDFFGAVVVIFILIFAVIGIIYSLTNLPQKAMFITCVEQGYYNIGQKQYQCIELTPK